jgi:alkylation response protein AidB-like acyl-CoA dehydrogenase
VIAALRELNFFALTIPAAYGGVEADTISTCAAIEEISRASAAVGVMLSVHNSLVSSTVSQFGNEAQKKEFLPALARGRIGAFSQTEPNAGSDPSAMISVAARDDDHYVLNGTKTFVTNGHIGEIFLVMAKTDPRGGNRGVSCFIVERDSPGLKVGHKEKKLGLRASDTVELSLTDCRVPAANLLGGEGMGFKIGMVALDTGRLGVASQALGIGQAALDESLRYACERIAFGRPIADLQAIQFMLADMAIAYEATRLLCHKAAAGVDSGKPDSIVSSYAKAYGADAAMHVATDAVQIFGGYGYTKEYPVEKLMRDAKLLQIYEGTSQIQRVVIARNLLGR